MVLLQTLGHESHRLGRVFERTTRRELADRREVVPVARGVPGGRQHQRGPDLGPVGKAESAGRDPHHHVRLTVDGHGPAHDPGVPAEAALPQVVPQHDPAVGTRLALFGEEAAAGLRRYAERFEEARGDAVSLHPLRAFLPPQVRVPIFERDHLFQDARRLGLPVAEVAGRHVVPIVGVGAGRGLPEADEPGEVRERKRSEQQRVQGAENGGIGREADGQGGDDEDGEARPLQHPAHGEPRIPEHLTHRLPSLTTAAQREFRFLS